jgi:hypothetical protein
VFGNKGSRNGINYIVDNVQKRALSLCDEDGIFSAEDEYMNRLYRPAGSVARSLVSRSCSGLRWSAQFYAEEQRMRRYYYFIDSRGELYLESSKHRNVATAIRDPKVISMMFKMMRPIRTEEKEELMLALGDHPDEGPRSLSSLARRYRYVSLCGKEKNFIGNEDPMSAVGFRDLVPPPPLSPPPQDVTDSGGLGERRLVYAMGELSEVFRPELLRVGKETGRLYHPIREHRRLKGEMGLLHPTLAQTLGRALAYDEELDSFILTYGGIKYTVEAV